MNLLDERLKHSNISIVLATIKVFLQYTTDNSNLQLKVYERVKSNPLFLKSSTPHHTYGFHGPERNI